MTVRTPLAVVAVFAAGVLAGCGGGKAPQVSLDDVEEDLQELIAQREDWYPARMVGAVDCPPRSAGSRPRRPSAPDTSPRVGRSAPAGPLRRRRGRPAVLCHLRTPPERRRRTRRPRQGAYERSSPDARRPALRLRHARPNRPPGYLTGRSAPGPSLGRVEPGRGFPMQADAHPERRRRASRPEAAAQLSADHDRRDGVGEPEHEPVAELLDDPRVLGQRRSHGTLLGVQDRHRDVVSPFGGEVGEPDEIREGDRAGTTTRRVGHRSRTRMRPLVVRTTTRPSSPGGRSHAICPLTVSSTVVGHDSCGTEMSTAPETVVTSSAENPSAAPRSTRPLTALRWPRPTRSPAMRPDWVAASSSATSPTSIRPEVHCRRAEPAQRSIAIRPDRVRASTLAAESIEMRPDWVVTRASPS